MNTTLIGKIKREMERVEREDTQVTNGLTFNLPRTLNKIDLYYNSRFLTGERDSDGFKKLFMNIVKHRVNAATKAIDIDTKDVRVIAEDGQSYYPAWFFERELKQFMKDEGFAKLFNDAAERGPRYGSVVVKNVNGSPKIVNLRNILWDPTVSDIKCSSFVHEKHVYTPDEFREIAQESGWENWQEVLDLYEDKKCPEIQVIESYGYFDKEDILGGEEDESDTESDFVKAQYITAGLEFYSDDPKKKMQSVRPVELYKKEIDEWPYLIWHWEEEENRCLGMGIVEDLFVNQEYHNDIAHLERKSLHWSSKKLFQTRDDTAPSNLFSDVSNGDVFTLKSEISAVPMEERNLPEYNLVFQRIDENANQRSFTFEVNTGEAMPSGTPFRMGALLSQAVNSHYAYKRENFALFIKNIILEFVIPAFKKKMKKAHTLCFDGSPDQMERISAFLVDSHMWKAIKDYEKKHGAYPTPEEYSRERAKVEQAVNNRSGLHMELPDGFYDDLEYRIEIDITGESVNTTDVETLSTIFQIVSQNPAALQNPAARGILEMIASRSGQNPIKLFGPRQTQDQAPQVPQGMPAPNTGMPMPDLGALSASAAQGANPANAQTL